MQVVVWGNAPLPAAHWEQIPVNKNFEEKSYYKEKIDARCARRSEHWKKHGITPPEDPEQ